MVQAAFEISEKFRVPCMLRLTTRTSHSSSLVNLGDFRPAPHPVIPYQKDITRTIPVPAFSPTQRLNAQKRTAAMEKAACASPFNRIVKPTATSKRPNAKTSKPAPLGIVTSAVAYQYVKEIFPEFTVLKLGWTNPFPADLVKKFAKTVRHVLVVEELDPFLEDQVKALGIKVQGHKTELNMLELNPDRLQDLRHELLKDVPKAKAVKPDASLPTRPPVLCAGCGHRGVFYTLAKLGATVTGDIGCYTLGAFPPLNAMDSTICMGASIGNAAGMRKAGLKGRICAVLGDSTFFHSGMTGILSAHYNGTPVTTVVLDNRITAMTGHQDNPGTGKTLAGDPAPVTEILDIAKACGYKKVVQVSADDLGELEATLKDAMDGDEGALVVAYAPCRIAAKLTKEGLCAVDETKCKACGMCFKMGCPAMTRGEEVAPGRFQMKIDPSLCAGCRQCQQVCKFGAIKRIK